MNRKLLTLLLIMVVAAATITVVSAAETVTVNGVEFNVPDGFKSQPEYPIADTILPQFGSPPNTADLKRLEDMIDLAASFASFLSASVKSKS